MRNPDLQSPTNSHFFQPLLPGFDSHLNIPLAFYLKYVQGRNKYKTAKLRSDASDTTWEVKIDDGRRLTGGWKDFVTAHDLRIGDVIVFRHEGDLVFHVTALGPSCCEIEYVLNNMRNFSMEEDMKTEGESFSSDQSCESSQRMSLSSQSENRFVKLTVTQARAKDGRLYLPRSFTRFHKMEKEKSKTIILLDKHAVVWPVTLSLRMEKKNRHMYFGSGSKQFLNANGVKENESFVLELVRGDTTSPPMFKFCSKNFVESKVMMKGSSKRALTKHSSKRKREAGESSQRASLISSSLLSENRFVTLSVTPTDLRYYRCYLKQSFTRPNGMEKAGGETIILVDKHGIEWPVKLRLEKESRKMYLGRGFREFLNAVGIKANEPFVLELVWEDKTSPPMLKFCSKV